MANSKIFASARNEAQTTTHNKAGGKAFALSDKAALAQMAVTGVFNGTFYSDAKSQLEDVKKLVAKIDDTKFLAKLAVYTRQKAYMKDMPSYLTAVLAAKDVTLLNAVFNRVIDNGRMLRNFVQIIRSGQAGRKSLGSRPKKLVAQWLTAANDAQLLAASVGTAPSLSDVIKLSHPKAKDASREAFFGYVTGRKVEAQALPQIVQDLEAFRKGDSLEVPKVPFELLTSLSLTARDWETIARNASWQQTRMNLNTFARHGVFQNREIVKLLAARLSDASQVARARVFPYQLLAAFLNIKEGVPSQLSNALQDAMEHAVGNIPTFDCDVAVLADVSGSMSQPVTGHRAGATTKVRCVDVAGLFASAVLRKNPNALVVPFDTKVHAPKLNARDSIMTNAQTLARYGGGGTNCGLAMKHLNDIGSMAELVVYVSDNESWVGQSHRRNSTVVMDEWARYKRRVRNAKLVCIDVVPNVTTQAHERSDILNVGGFSDEVFNIVELFARGELTPQHWVGEIEKVEL